jgi:hypothetical protein
MGFNSAFKGLNAELNSIHNFLALLGAHPIYYISGVRVKSISFVLTYVFGIHVKFNILSSTKYFNNIFVTVWDPRMH